MYLSFIFVLRFIDALPSSAHPMTLVVREILQKWHATQILDVLRSRQIW